MPSGQRSEDRRLFDVTPWSRIRLYPISPLGDLADDSGTFVETGGIPIKLSKPDAEGKTSVIIPGNKKDVKEFDGKRYLFEPAIHGDVAILRAWKVDKAGNCVFR